MWQLAHELVGVFIGAMATLCALAWWEIKRMDK